MVRTITEILKEADLTDELSVLNECWNEIFDNKHKYPLVQLHFSEEHLKMLTRKLAKKDLDSLSSI